MRVNVLIGQYRNIRKRRYTLKKQKLGLLLASIVLVTAACQPAPAPTASTGAVLDAAPHPTAATPAAAPTETAQDPVERQPSHLPEPLPEGLAVDIYRMNQHPIAEDLTFPQVLDALQGQSHFSRFQQGDSFCTTLSMAAIAENNAALIPFGYYLTPNVVSNAVDLYQGEKLVLGSISAFGKVSVNQSATDFMMLVYTSDSRKPFVVVHAGSLEEWQRSNGWITNSQPQYLNNDVMYPELKAAQQVSVYRSGRVIYTTDAPDRPAASGLIGFWTFIGHWSLEVVDRVIIDGQPVNERYGYTKSYEFHVLNQKPLFFFEKDGRLGLNYDGNEIPLPWQSIDHYGCCSGGTLNPVQVGNLLLFFARQGDRWDYVELEAPADSPTTGNQDSS
jgi:hypothetical protein